MFPTFSLLSFPVVKIVNGTVNAELCEFKPLAFPVAIQLAILGHVIAVRLPPLYRFDRGRDIAVQFAPLLVISKATGDVKLLELVLEPTKTHVDIVGQDIADIESGIPVRTTPKRRGVTCSIDATNTPPSIVPIGFLLLGIVSGT